ncbi:hypothetical protein B0H11DRAFT_1126737 [Mycena galericulata]|nr:hypothetical protein B0H11DRAFT_1126737 [Mycena galericulata]
MAVLVLSLPRTCILSSSLLSLSTLSPRTCIPSPSSSLFSPSHSSPGTHFIPSTLPTTLAFTRSTLPSLPARFSIHATGASPCIPPSPPSLLGSFLAPSRPIRACPFAATWQSRDPIHALTFAGRPVRRVRPWLRRGRLPRRPLHHERRRYHLQNRRPRDGGGKRAGLRTTSTTRTVRICIASPEASASPICSCISPRSSSR